MDYRLDYCRRGQHVPVDQHVQQLRRSDLRCKTPLVRYGESILHRVQSPVIARLGRLGHFSNPVPEFPVRITDDYPATVMVGTARSGGESPSRSGNVEAALSRYVACLRQDLNDELDTIFLFGSHARGDAVEGSDIDVLVILKNPFDYGEMLDRTSAATAEVSLDHDVVISRAFSTREDYETKMTPFLMNIRKDATAL